MSTRAGRDLATRLVRHYLPWPTPEDTDLVLLDETCSLLLRHGTTYNRLEERVASDSTLADEKLMAQVERRQANLERRMGQLLKQLPPPQDGYHWQLRFEGLFGSLECVSDKPIPGHADVYDVRSIPLSNY